MKSSDKQRGRTPNCPVLTWMYLKIICPVSNHKLKILTYISQRERGINRNISQDRHWQQTLLDLNQEQLSLQFWRKPCISVAGTYAGLGCSVFRGCINVFSNSSCTQQNCNLCRCSLVNFERQNVCCGKLLQTMRFQQLSLCSSL